MLTENVSEGGRIPGRAHSRKDYFGAAYLLKGSCDCSEGLLDLHRLVCNLGDYKAEKTAKCCC